MKIRNIFLFLFLVISIVGISAQSRTNIIPKPVSVIEHQGFFEIKDQMASINMSKEAAAKPAEDFLIERIVTSTGFTVNIRETDDFDTENFILFKNTNDSQLGEEGYTLLVEPGKIVITANAAPGFLYAAQTLIQLLPPEVYLFLPEKKVEWKIPCVEITDYPRYQYRGMHLDVSRHFFPAEFVKKYIDILASYKFNRFHWHLTDDNGWRIEIEKYPLLQEISAWRVDREHQPWTEWSLIKEGEKATYGGYYSKEEVREIIQYAKDRCITIIPEIEMPAHSVEVLAAYPELSCTGGPFNVLPGSYWPNVDILCAGNESTFTFLENVLTEVLELFPSEYIHIGGDEADKTRWEACPKCQKRIKDEGLKDEKELQSYFIKRIEKFVKSKGKKIIGWDEILEGGLPPDATVMSWRGMQGGIDAATQGYDVIMTPVSHCYFDYYQADPEFQPKAIGGFTSLKKVYLFEPTPSELTEQQAKHILGAQANLWSEFIPTGSHAEYMVLPRMIALSEVNWSRKDSRDWIDFRTRLEEHFKKLSARGINYSTGSYKVNVKTTFENESKSMKVELDTEQVNPEIHYTLDGSLPEVGSPVYKEPIILTGTTKVKAGIFVDGKLKEKYSTVDFIAHSGLGGKVNCEIQYNPEYPAKGANNLIDGLRGSDRFNDGFWQGYAYNDLSCTIAFDESTEVESLSAGFFQNYDSWIFLPEFVEYFVSEDGLEYQLVGKVENDIDVNTKGALIKDFSIKFESIDCKSIKIHAKNRGTCPQGHPAEVEASWIFSDELIVE
ncbi:MAG: family 20 glycosylhydrolase [bacterium]